MSEWLTVKEAAKLKKCDETTIRSRAYNSKIAYRKINGKKMVKKSEIKNIEIERQGKCSKKKLQKRMKKMRELGEDRKNRMVDLIVDCLINNEEREENGRAN